MFLILGGLSVKADSKQPTWYEIPCSCSYQHYSNGSYPRSVFKTPKIYEALPYILVSGTQEASVVSITISNANGMDVKKETIIVSSDQNATIYIGDLESGTYDLTIELEYYTLYGCFEIE